MLPTGLQAPSSHGRNEETHSADAKSRRSGPSKENATWRRGRKKGSTVKKNQNMKKNLRLEKEVLLQLHASKLQKIVGGLSVDVVCGTAFICGTQVCP